MKRIAYFIFFSALVSSCAFGPENYAHIEFRDSGAGNFLLQSFSDSSVRVLNFKNDSMRVVAFHDIRKFVLHGDEIDLYSTEGKARLQKSIEPNKDIWKDERIK